MRILGIIVGLSMLCWSGVFAAEYRIIIPDEEINQIFLGFKPTQKEQFDNNTLKQQMSFIMDKVLNRITAPAKSVYEKKAIKVRRKAVRTEVANMFTGIVTSEVISSGGS